MGVSSPEDRAALAVRDGVELSSTRGVDVLARVGEGPLRQVRSTLLCSSVAELRRRGFFEPYIRNLSAATADILVPGVASTWLPLEVAMEHYEACERLTIGADDAYAFGAASAERVQHAFLRTFVAVARGAGAGPLTVLPKYPRMWGRHFAGGNVVVTRAGAKDVLLDIRDVPLARYAFFRNAFRGANDAALRMFASTVYVREQRSSPTSFCLRLSWV